MTTSNPFRQPLRGDVDFRAKVYNADANGKDRSNGHSTDFALNSEYLWIAKDFSVPLAWIDGVKPLGPGFAVTWQNPLNGKREFAALCARRLFGYDLKRRDELVARANAARATAKSRPAPVVVASAAAMQRCERCSAPNAITCDYVYVITFLLLFVSKPDRRIFCAHHARVFAALNALSNLILGSLGIAIIFSPLATIGTTRRLRHQRVLSPGAANATIAVALLPYLLVIWYIVYLIRPH
jgi:hypothetical protein